MIRQMNRLQAHWTRFWARRAGLDPFGRLAARLAGWFVPPYKGRYALARQAPRGYIAPSAVIHHPGLHLGRHVFIGERVVIYAGQGTGPVDLADGVHLNNDVSVEVGQGGQLSIGAHTFVQPRCHFAAYKAAIRIGSGVQIAPNCAFYPYDHGLLAGRPISQQPLSTKGDIVIGDDAWLGYGVVVLSGVRIGAGAVIGANSVVTRDVPDGAIAVGVPARVVKMRSEA